MLTHLAALARAAVEAGGVPDEDRPCLEDLEDLLDVRLITAEWTLTDDAHLLAAAARAALASADAFFSLAEDLSSRDVPADASARQPLVTLVVPG